MAEDRCVICGAVIPEGRQVCLLCETLVYESDQRSRRAEEQAFIDGMEFALDWGFEVPEEDYKRYCELTVKEKKRRLRRCGILD